MTKRAGFVNQTQQLTSMEASRLGEIAVVFHLLLVSDVFLALEPPVRAEPWQ